jgi:hypothetical protein
MTAISPKRSPKQEEESQREMQNKLCKTIKHGQE